MSETVHYRGILTKVERLENKSLEEQCKRLLNNKQLKYCTTYKEMILDDCYYDYFIYDDILYSVNKQSIDLDEDIFKSSENKDGSISFEVRYYNGGCGFHEALEYALENKNPFQN